MFHQWNNAAAAVINGQTAAAKSREHWRSMVTSVAKNVRAQKDVYTWDGNYLATIVPIS